MLGVGGLGERLDLNEELLQPEHSTESITSQDVQVKRGVRIVRDAKGARSRYMGKQMGKP